MTTILIVLSAADHWTQSDGSTRPTGFFAEEVVKPHQIFTEAGFEVEFATPRGVRPALDQASVDPNVVGEGAPGFADYLATISGALGSPVSLEGVDVTRYAAVVVPGGHAPMEDLPYDEGMGAVLQSAEAADVVVAAVCHGPAALLSAEREDGTWLYAGRNLVSITDAEEADFGTAETAPWLLETRLRERGAKFDGAGNWEVQVVRDGNLITGQNPGSSEAMAQAVVEAVS